MPSAPRIPFQCPICRGKTYIHIGTTHTTKRPIHQCGGCSVLFVDPDLFTRFQPHADSPTPNLRTHSAPLKTLADKPRTGPLLVPRATRRV